MWENQAQYFFLASVSALLVPKKCFCTALAKFFEKICRCMHVKHLQFFFSYNTTFWGFRALLLWPFACIFSNFLWGMRYAWYQVVHEKAAPERLVLLVVKWRMAIRKVSLKKGVALLLSINVS